jgi:hypothetical protein
MNPPSHSNRLPALGLPTVQLAGPWDQGELSLLRDAIDSASRWTWKATLPEVTASISLGERPPELVLLAQPRPGSVDQLAIEELRRLAPLVRVVVVAGSWCEGELRTGRLLSGVIRLYWHEFEAWWHPAVDAANCGRNTPWSAPLDDIRAGRQGLIVSQASPAPRGIVAIDAVDYGFFEALQLALSPFGWQCRWERRQPAMPIEVGTAEPSVAGLWDGGQLDPCELASLERFAERLAKCGAPTIALLDYPRSEHVAMTLDAGVNAMFGKPVDITILASELARLTTAPKLQSPPLTSNRPAGHHWSASAVRTISRTQGGS